MTTSIRQVKMIEELLFKLLVVFPNQQVNKAFKIESCPSPDDHDLKLRTMVFMFDYEEVKVSFKLRKGVLVTPPWITISNTKGETKVFKMRQKKAKGQAKEINFVWEELDHAP